MNQQQPSGVGLENFVQQKQVVTGCRNVRRHLIQAIKAAEHNGGIASDNPHSVCDLSDGYSQLRLHPSWHIYKYLPCTSKHSSAQEFLVCKHRGAGSLSEPASNLLSEPNLGHGSLRELTQRPVDAVPDLSLVCNDVQQRRLPVASKLHMEGSSDLSLAYHALGFCPLMCDPQPCWIRLLRARSSVGQPPLVVSAGAWLGYCESLGVVRGQGGW